MTTVYTLTGVFGQDEGANIGFGTVLNFAGAGVTATAAGSTITVTIPGGGGGTTGWTSYYDYTATGGQVTFSATGITAAPTKHQVFVNGGLRRIGAQKDYTLSGDNVVFNSGLSVNAVVTIYVA
jgi:hypothetical protein